MLCCMLTAIYFIYILFVWLLNLCVLLFWFVLVCGCWFVCLFVCLCYCLVVLFVCLCCLITWLFGCTGGCLDCLLFALELVVWLLCLCLGIWLLWLVWLLCLMICVGGVCGCLPLATFVVVCAFDFVCLILLLMFGGCLVFVVLGWVVVCLVICGLGSFVIGWYLVVVLLLAFCVCWLVFVLVIGLLGCLWLYLFLIAGVLLFFLCLFNNVVFVWFLLNSLVVNCCTLCLVC